MARLEAEPTSTGDELRGLSLVPRVTLTRGGLQEGCGATNDPRPGLWKLGAVGVGRRGKGLRGWKLWEKDRVVEPHGAHINRAGGEEAAC